MKLALWLKRQNVRSVADHSCGTVGWAFYEQRVRHRRVVRSRVTLRKNDEGVRGGGAREIKVSQSDGKRRTLERRVPIGQPGRKSRWR